MTSAPLTGYFRSQGADQLEVTPGLYVPRRFTDPEAEHRATRAGAGLFDFSFMSHFEIQGPAARAFLRRLQIRAIPETPGRILYTMLCRGDGTVFVDATVWVHGDSRYWLFTGRRADSEHVRAQAAGFDVEVRDRSGELSVLALQGPASPAILARLAPATPPGLRYFRFARADIDGRAAWIGRIGYTGERGYELLVQRETAVALWGRLLSLGARACGFEAADALRIEAGYILFDRELRYHVTPEALGGGWMRRAAAAAPQVLVGLLPLPSQARGRPWAGLALPPGPRPPVAPGIGCLTSARHSPLFGTELGLGYVCHADRHPGTTVRLQDGRYARVARLPFFDPPRRVPRT